MPDIAVYLVEETIYHALVPVVMALLMRVVCEKKRGFAGFAVIGIILVILVPVFRLYADSAGLFASELWQTGILSLIRMRSWSIFLAAVFVYVKLCFVCSWPTALFCFLTGYSVLELIIGATLYFRSDSRSAWANALLELVIAAAVITATVAVFGQKMNRNTMLALQKRHKAPMLLLFLLVFVFAAISVRVVLAVNQVIPLMAQSPQLFADELRYLEHADAYGMLTSILGNFVILFALYHLLAYTETDLNERLASTMYHQEREQYEQFKVNVDYINERYHDLKHTLALLKTDRDGAERMLNDITENVAFLQSEIDTGDETLDHVLTDRYLLCQSKGIELHVMTDGTTFEWMDTIDLYLIFCNILDNAMEYLETIEAKRRIVVKIRTVRQMIFIHQENVLQESLHMEGGIPVTTKGETHDHGFGIKSIVATAARYDGAVTINTEDCKFSVDIMFQKPDKGK